MNLKFWKHFVFVKMKQNKNKKKQQPNFIWSLGSEGKVELSNVF